MSKILKFISCTYFLILPLPGLSSVTFPNVCSIVNSASFSSCMDLKISTSMCGWPIPRPCARFSYYVPVDFVEAVSNPKETFFGSLPGVSMQMSALGSALPFGSEDDDGSYAFHAHSLTVPFVSIPYNGMPCGSVPIERWCMEAMSEHVDRHWHSGSGDLMQPAFLAWSAAPKACLMYGSASSVSGEVAVGRGAAPICSFPNPLPVFPPSPRQVCNGWGTFFPRSGVYTGSSQVGAALMVADRIRSLGNEVFGSIPSSPDEKWQMISPTKSQCFRRGQNLGFLETAKTVTDAGRLTGGGLRNYLFTVWKRVSCTRDIPYIVSTTATVGLMNSVCRGL